MTEYEVRWCKFCITRTPQEITFLPQTATYKRRRLYKCSVCGHTSWMQGKRPSAESVY